MGKRWEFGYFRWPFPIRSAFFSGLLGFSSTIMMQTLYVQTSDVSRLESAFSVVARHARRKWRALSALVALLPTVLWLTAAAPSTAPQSGGGDWLMFVGTYTRDASKGIYAYRYDGASGKLTSIGVAAETQNPSFLAIHPNQRFLYAVNEISQFENQPAGSVSAFAIDSETGTLKLLNRVSSRGTGPCHVSLDAKGKWLFVANYGGGSVAAYPVAADGTLGEASTFFQHAGSSVNPQRQKGPHAHEATPSPDNRFVLVADLGLDQVLAYKLDAAKGLVANDPPFARIDPGSGPRHLAFRPDGRFVYVVNELSSKVTALRFDGRRGTMEPVQSVSTLPEGFTGTNSTAEIAVHPNAQFVYASNRGHNSVAIFRIDRAKGTLEPVDRVSTGGKTPRNFTIDPSGKFLLAANQETGNVVQFSIEQKTGTLTPTGVAVDVPMPVCVVFAKAARATR
jgi:6-phosphogluconolactonase